MSTYKKHTDVVSSMGEYEINVENGLYEKPYVVFIGNAKNGYSIVYSNDEKKHDSPSLTDIEILTARLRKLEEEKVYCYESEYDALITGATVEVTNIDGTKSPPMTYDSNKMYYIYEEDGPVQGGADNETENDNVVNDDNTEGGNGNTSNNDDNTEGGDTNEGNDGTTEGEGNEPNGEDNPTVGGDTTGGDGETGNTEPSEPENTDPETPEVNGPNEENGEEGEDDGEVNNENTEVN